MLMFEIYHKVCDHTFLPSLNMSILVPHGIMNNPFDFVSMQTVIPAVEIYFINGKQSNIQAEKQVPDGER